MKKVFEQEGVKIYKLEDKKISIVELVGRFEEDAYKKTLLKCLDVLVEVGYSKVILNALLLVSSTASSRAWAATSYSKLVNERLPKARLATVKSKNLFQSLAFNVIRSTLLRDFKDFKVEIFETIDEAIVWLEAN